MNETPIASRKHISIFGKTNSGKSSLLNAIIGQDISIVSSVEGTTTDPVRKTMELIPYGPVVFTDTAGLDDTSQLGELRLDRTMKTLHSTDFAIYVMDINDPDQNTYKYALKQFSKYSIPYMTVINKIDIASKDKLERLESACSNALFVSADKGTNILRLKDELIKRLKEDEPEETIVGDLVPYNGRVVMVVPVDFEAPKGRIILPQVQLIRDCLDHGIKSYVVRDSELESALSDMSGPDLVVTDSQAFKNVSRIVPRDIKLTSFSILFARYKGDLDTLVNGAMKVEELKDGDMVLISEACTHNYSHEDIGRVKIPMLLNKYTGKKIKYDFKMGSDFPENIEEYALVIHCGACMLNRKAMQTRIDMCTEKNVKITNYGVLLAYLNKILPRCLEIFKSTEKDSASSME